MANTKLPGVDELEGKITYQDLGDDRVLVTAHRRDGKPLQTIVHIVPPEEFEEEELAPEFPELHSNR